MRVLLIDDESAVRKIVHKRLKRAGHEVVEAQNGRVGMAKLEMATFDLIVTDIIMPEMEGIETLMNVRQRYPTIAIVAMSGGGRTGNIDFLEVAQKMGAAAVLQKPFTYNSLVEAIDRSCGECVNVSAEFQRFAGTPDDPDDICCKHAQSIADLV